MSETPRTKGSILFLSKRVDAASTRYRISQYLPLLVEQGWRCRYRSVNRMTWVDRLRLAASSREFDIVVIQRKLFGGLFLRLLAYFNPHIVFDYDDAVFLNDDGSPSRRRQKRFIHSTRVARLALAGNAYLAEQSQCANTIVFPTSVVFSRYESINRPAGDDATLTLVWVGSRSTQKYLQQHRKILQSIGNRCKHLRLKIVSDFDIAFDPLPVQCIPWSKDSELEEIAAADIGIAPMGDDPWTRGKCGLKVIQYMASGLPVISSNCGANAEIVRHNETGFLVDSSEEWIQAIEQLRDKDLRIRFGKAGRQRAREYYSAESLSEKLDEQFTKLLGG